MVDGFLEGRLRFSRLVLLCFLFTAGGFAQERVVVDRGNSTIVLEPYAPNIIRVTLSLLKQPALAPPGYGFTGTPSATGWTHEGNTYHSNRLTVTMVAGKPRQPLATEQDIGRYFNGSTPGAHILFSTAEGTKLLELEGWEMAVPNHKDGTASVVNDKRSGDQDFYQGGATFGPPD